MKHLRRETAMEEVIWLPVTYDSNPLGELAD